ncbi:uncharacterized protein BN684_02026 [Clostridium sp. CAG:505]|nr:uncharacterized protein BN684_02026 [Clostridium sp. CAG:505]
MAAIEVFRIVFGEVSCFCGDAPFESTFIGFQFTHEDTEQCGSCDFVFANESNFVVGTNHKAYVIQHFFAVDGLGQTFYQQYVIAHFSILFEAAERVSSGRRFDGIHLQVIQQFFTAGCLFCFGSVSTETLDEFLQFFDLLFHAFVLVFQLTLCHLCIAVPEIVVTNEHGDFAIVDVGDVGTNLIQEMSVVGYDNNGIFKVHQEAFQPFDSMQVQMVGRFVQQQDVRIAEERLCQQDFHLLGTCQFFHFYIMEFVGNTQTIQEDFRVGFGRPAVQFRKFPFQFGNLDAIFIGKVLFRVKGFFFLHNVIETFVAVQNGFHNFKFVEHEVVLFQYCHTFTGSNEYRAFVGFQFTCQYFQKCGLAGTVSTNESVAVAFGKVDVHIIEQYASAVL